MITTLVLPIDSEDWVFSAADGFYCREIRESRVDIYRSSIVRNGCFEFSIIKARHCDAENAMAWYYTNDTQSVPFEVAWEFLTANYPDVAEYFLFNPEKIR